MPQLQGKVAIVTGAGGGIGSATAATLAQAGCAVVCVDRDGEPLRRVVDEIRAGGGSALACEADVATEHGNREMVAHAVDAFGGLDILHANAAVQRFAGIDETSDADWEALWRTNVQGAGLGVTAALPALRARGGGVVVLTSSVLGIVGMAEMPAYGATKGALRAMCRSLAVAHGPENVRCNTVCPGDVDTAMLQEYFDLSADPRALRERMLAHYPMRRFASPRDVANVVAFLASDEAAYLTGIDIPVEGGLLAQLY